MSSHPPSPERPFSDPHKRVERVAFLSDALFAIAITLLALEVKLPASIGHEEEFTWDALWQVAPALSACATSFVTIGLSWWAHTKIFERLVAVDGGFIAFNLARLFLVTLVPFGTMILSHGAPAREAWVSYAGLLTLNGVAELAMWKYAASKPTLVGDITPATRLGVTLRIATAPSVYAVSALAGLYSFGAGWLVLAVIRRPRTRSWDASRAAPKRAPWPHLPGSPQLPHRPPRSSAPERRYPKVRPLRVSLAAIVRTRRH